MINAVAKGGPTIQMLIETEDIPREYQIIITPDIEEVSSPAYLKKLKAQKIVESQERLTPKVKRQVTAWTGSPYDFEKFKTEKIGTGVGSRIFGWGLYFTDLEDIAKDYAKNVTSSITYSYEGIDNINNVSTLPMTRVFLSEMRKSMPNSREEALEWVEKNSRGKSEKVIEELRYFANKLIVNGGGKGYIYNVSIHKGKKPSQYVWLEWNNRTPKKVLDKVLSALTDEQYKKAFPYGVDRVLGAGLYYDLSNALGGDKEASLFLLENGIDGIRYTTDAYDPSYTGKKNFNYVVFDENAITINEKIKLQKISKAQGSQLEAQMYDYLLSISEKKSDKTYKLPFTLDEFISFMSPAFSRQRATEIYKNVSKGITQGKIDDAYEASRKLLDAEKNKI